MSETLKSCPFCGADDVLLYKGAGRGGVRRVLCDCGCCGALAYSEKEAVAAWNRRVEDEGPVSV